MGELRKIIIFVLYKAGSGLKKTSVAGIDFEYNISVNSLQDNVVAMPLNDAHLATLFNFKRVGYE